MIVQDRLWFNEANESRYFLVPGLVVLVMTVLGALLTALVVAREWEQGTFEALFVTPVRAGEILLRQSNSVFGLGHFRTGTVHACRQIPLPGSVSRFAVGVKLRVRCSISLLRSGYGLLISSTVKSQFVAGLITVVADFSQR